MKMILEGERVGALTPGKTIIDATSGNTGIAYAMIAAARGYRVKLCLPRNASQERKRMLQAYGAELVLTDPLQGSDGAIRGRARDRRRRPRCILLPRPVQQPGQLAGALRNNGRGDLEQTEGRITHFRRRTRYERDVYGRGPAAARTQARSQLISMEPDSPFHGLGRAQAYGDGHRAGNLRPVARR